MARKNLLTGLMADPAPPPADDPDATDVGADDAVALPAPPRRSGGAIGAVGKSFAEMRANAVIEIPADMIDGAGVTDRLGDDPDHDALVRSIREYGQQVPVLVRHSPNYQGRYDIVYGRRRVSALRALRRPVRAMVRDLPDRDLIIAQGQENTGRVNLSFIEKASFAGQMAAMNFDRKVICDALALEKTAVSKMLTVAEALPVPLIRAIGSAPGTGRDRWLRLARDLRDAEAAMRAIGGIVGSDARFEAALASTRAARPAPPKAQTDTRDWGRISRGVRGTTISLGTSPFGDWLLGRMDELHARWAEDQQRNNQED